MMNIDVEINSIQSIKNSASKLLMKKCFDEAGVKTAKWGIANNLEELKTLAKELTGNWKNYLVCKSHQGSRGVGNTLVKSEVELITWSGTRNLSNYIFEKYYSYSREYRLHVSEGGYCFYTCRKMLKENTSKEDRWKRNSENCVWYLEENINFNKPNNWQEIVDECVKALKAVGLDMGAVDLRVSSKDNSFCLIEINSAPSMQEITLQKYLEEIPKIIERKVLNYGA